MNPRRLYRSRDRQLAGVAGGMAEYLDIDPTVMRILWILAGLLSVGFAILAYIVLAIVIPDTPWAPGATGSPSAWGSAPSATAQGWASPTGGWAPTGQGTPAPAAPAWSAYPPAAPAAPAAPATGGWATTGAAQSGGWSAAGSAPEPRAEGRRIGVAAIVGVALIAIGGVALLNVVVPGWVAPAALGPAILMAIGAAFVVSSIRRTPPRAKATTGASPAPSVMAEGRGEPGLPAMPAVPAAPTATSVDALSTDSGVSDETTAIPVPDAGVSAEDDGSRPA